MSIHPDSKIEFGAVSEAYEFVLKKDEYLSWTGYLSEIWTSGQQVFLNTKTENGFFWFRLMQDMGHGWPVFASLIFLGGLGQKTHEPLDVIFHTEVAAPKKKFIYRDNSKSTWDPDLHMWFGPVVFKCEAATILEADALFAAADLKFITKSKNKDTEISSKIGVMMLPFIGCSSRVLTK